MCVPAFFAEEVTSGKYAMNAKSLLISLAVTILGSVSTAFAAEPPPAAPTSKEMREKMATFHEQLAACLRSDKPIAECHKEAMKHHQELMGKEGCPMMNEDGRRIQKQSSTSISALPAAQLFGLNLLTAFFAPTAPYRVRPCRPLRSAAARARGALQLNR
jgi:hypothetical protein